MFNLIYRYKRFFSSLKRRLMYRNLSGHSIFCNCKRLGNLYCFFYYFLNIFTTSKKVSSLRVLHQIFWLGVILNCRVRTIYYNIYQTSYHNSESGSGKRKTVIAYQGHLSTISKKNMFYSCSPCFTEFIMMVPFISSLNEG